MDLLPSSNGARRQYALVGYLPDPLGAFLQRLRADLVPGCRLLSHLTLLPPRELSLVQTQLISTLVDQTAQIASFEVEIGEVDIFPTTNVIYLSIAGGCERLAQLHDGLNSGPFAAQEPFAFHPHITLAQDLLPQSVETTLNLARKEWAGWNRSRSFSLERLTLVKNVNRNHWETISEHPLQPRSLLRTV